MEYISNLNIPKICHVPCVRGDPKIKTNLTKFYSNKITSYSFLIILMPCCRCVIRWKFLICFVFQKQNKCKFVFELKNKSCGNFWSIICFRIHLQILLCFLIQKQICFVFEKQNKYRHLFCFWKTKQIKNFELLWHRGVF